MSSDATAIVFFGFPLPSLKVDESELNDEWIEDHRPKKPDDNADYKTPEWDEWRAKMKLFEATPQHVEIEWCGSESGQSYFIHCPCYEQKVDWEIVKLSLRDDTAEAQRWLDAFCDLFNLPKKIATWHLGARYF